MISFDEFLDDRNLTLILTRYPKMGYSALIKQLPAVEGEGQTPDKSIESLISKLVGKSFLNPLFKDKKIVFPSNLMR